MGIVVLLATFLVLGFLFAWVANIVAREEVEVKTGLLVLVVAFVVSLVASFALNALARPIAGLLMPLVNFGSLVLTTHLFAKLSWKHSAIIAAVYTVILLGISLAMVACAAAA